MSQYFIGLMSGTSLDGVDAVLADFSERLPRVLAAQHLSFGPALRAELLALNQPGENELERAALAANQLAQRYANVVQRTLASANLGSETVRAIGCHGQTVRHRPDLGYTLQLNNPALLAERSGIAVVADFRTRDLAAGGQGAPLVPAFHHAVFAHRERHRVIVNIGGIANLTDLPCSAVITGFDCGPGNMLMDAWCERHTGKPFDDNGTWAASGKVIPELLATLLDEPFFTQAPPKSTGRDLFSLAWLETKLKPDYKPEDIQATLLKLSLEGIRRAVRSWCGEVDEVFVCGGGARNSALMNSLRHAFADVAVPVAATDVLGVPAEQVEALAFAWLAKRALDNKPGNMPSVTGARHACVLGAIYPA